MTTEIDFTQADAQIEALVHEHEKARERMRQARASGDAAAEKEHHQAALRAIGEAYRLVQAKSRSGLMR